MIAFTPICRYDQGRVIMGKAITMGTASEATEQNVMYTFAEVTMLLTDDDKS